MQSLKFNQLLVLSNTTKSANQFKFSKTLNLITAADNSVGKSTLLKLLFWGLGCEPELDTTWKAQDCTTIVEFEVLNDIYRIKRYKNQISIKENDSQYVTFDKITGEYSKRFAEIVNFKALLPNQNSNLLETPPPAYYFLPFYIDQKRSWSKAWENFDNLGQYSNWKSTIVKYHVGLLKPEHFEIETEKTDKKETQKELEVDVEKIDTTLEIVENYIPKSFYTHTKTEMFNKMAEQIRLDLTVLQENQEKLLNDLAIYNAEKTYFKQQQIITEKIIYELDQDYKFSIENIENEDIECPLCGTIHENSIINRASILTDKTQAENQLTEILKQLNSIDKKIQSFESDLEQARKEINEINSKYVIDEKGNNEKIEFNQIIESIAGQSIKENVIITKENKQASIKKLADDIKKLSKEQKELVTTEHKELTNNTFNSILTKYIKMLEAESVNLSDINSPLDFSKVIKEGGAAEGARASLAYYLTIYSMVEKFGSEVKTALVIDTPNQQEQSHTNYDKIVSLLTNEFTNNQIIMGAMENEHLKPFADKAQIITLSLDRLLHKDKYEIVKNEFE